MNYWDLNNEDDLIELSEMYSSWTVQLIMEEHRRGELKTPLVRREYIAQKIGMPIDVLMMAVAKGADLLALREIEAMTPEELAEMERRAEEVTEADEFIVALIGEAIEERNQQQAEIEALNKLFAS
jgi:hypothetical protein